MPPITVPASKYRVAATGRTDGIPDHAIEIAGPLIEIGVKNLAEWGITDSAVAGILERGVGIPIRMCNDIDPHACDLANDNYSQVGYVTEMWQDGGWIHANAAITKQDAVDNISDGTWTPFSDGSWSAVGLVEGESSEFEEDGMVSQLSPQAIAIFTPPATPAYVGSKFELVAAAVTSSSELKLMTEPNIDPEAPGTQVPAADPPVVVAPPEVTPPTEGAPAEPEPGETYTQEDLDIAIKTALETQKADHDATIAQMTSNTDMQAMFASVKTETIDEINRTKLVDDYVDTVTASTVLSAPYMVDGKIDPAKMTTRRDELMALKTASVEQAITDAKVMVAAIPAGKTAFNAAAVQSKTVTDDSAAAIRELKEATGRL